MLAYSGRDAGYETYDACVRRLIRILMPRRKPTSTRQKKADQQLKRAIKRGDVPPPEPKENPHHRKPKKGPTGNQIGSSDNATVIESARKLQSAFIKLPPKYLEETKLLASTLALCRPIPIEKAIFKSFYITSDLQTAVLTCPKRPKWRFDMSKLEVERNEEGVFKKWLAQTDQLLEEWQNRVEQNPCDNTTTAAQLRSPSYFERNLEVWRQLYVRRNIPMAMFSLKAFLSTDGELLRSHRSSCYCWILDARFFIIHHRSLLIWPIVKLFLF